AGASGSATPSAAVVVARVSSGTVVVLVVGAVVISAATKVFVMTHVAADPASSVIVAVAVAEATVTRAPSHSTLLNFQLRPAGADGNWVRSWRSAYVPGASASSRPETSTAVPAAVVVAVPCRTAADGAASDNSKANGPTAAPTVTSWTARVAAPAAGA